VRTVHFHRSLRYSFGTLDDGGRDSEGRMENDENEDGNDNVFLFQ